MTKIALVAASPAIVGGQSVQAMALAGRLKHDGHAVDYIPIDPAFPSPLRAVRRWPYVRTLLNQALYIPSLNRLRHADVVHIFSASYWSFLIAPAPAIVAAKLLRKPVILHYHSGEAADHLARWGGVVAPFLRMVDEIVVPSVYLQEVFASFGYRTRVIHNIIDTSAFRYRERLPLLPRLLSVRNLEQYYRVENTLRAFACLKESVPNATLTVAGYGSQERELRQLAGQLGVDGVAFLGAVDPAALPAAYDYADIFLNSSIVDNQPVSILEAFAAGLPVVTTPTGDIAAMVRDGRAGLLVKPEDPTEMAGAIIRLLQEPALASQIASRAREEVEKYTWSVVGRQWTALYDDVLALIGPEPQEAHVGLR